MKELSYELLLNPSEKRKVIILSSILEAEYDVSLSELASNCNVSIKTIKRDLDSLLEDLPNTLLLKENSLVSLEQFCNRDSITEYINLLMQDNVLFSIIERNFHGKPETIESVAEIFFLAESTVRKYLTVLKKILKGYGLSLSLSPIELVGSEINIRYFYFQYFSQSSYDTLVKTEIQNVDVYNKLRNIFSQYQISLNLNYRRLVEWLIIIDKRISQECFVHFDEATREKYMSLKSFFEVKNAIRKELENTSYSNVVTDDEILFAFLISLDAVIYDTRTHFFLNDYFEELVSFDLLTTEFFKRTNISYSVNIELKSILNAYLVNLSILTDLSPLFQKSELQLRRTMQKNHPDTLKRWLNILEEDNRFTYRPDVAANLTALTEAQINRKKSVLFVINGTSPEVSYYKYLASKLIPRTVDLHFVFNQSIDDQMIEKMNIDFCVSNFTFITPLERCPFFQFSDIPLQPEWKELLLRLNQL